VLIRLKGEASINTRKGKIFHIYELDIKLKISGKCQDELFEGSITYPEISVEQDDDDQDLELKIDKSPNCKNKVLDAMRKKGGLKKCNQTLASVLKEFKQLKGEIKEVKEVKPLTAAADLIGRGVPLELVQESKGEDTSKMQKDSKSSDTVNQSKEVKPTSEPVKSAAGMPKGLSTGTIKEDFKFRARSGDIYESLIDQRRVESYTQSPAKIEPRPGGSFEMYGGNISGTFIELVSKEKIVQKWRVSSWPEGHFSKVVMNLEDTPDGCVLHLNQENVPREEVANIKQAWNLNVFERMRRLFGFGSVSM